MSALLIAGTAVSAGGAIESGKAKSRASLAQGQAAQYQAELDAQSLEYNAKVAENNAIIADYNSQIALNQATEKEQAQRRSMAFMRGQARAAAAQSGAGTDGSNADVMRQNDILAELDALNIRYGGQMADLGFRTTAGNLRSQADMNRYMAGRAREGGKYNMRISSMNADSEMTAGYLNAASSLLSGGTKYYGYTGGYSGGGGSTTNRFIP